MNKKYDLTVIGCGMTGAVVAERAASQYNKKVLIIDKKGHVAGNCYDYKDKGVMVHKYGPHIFHTDNKAVWDYLCRFTEWHPYMHRVLAYIDGMEVPIPFNLNSIYQVFPPLMAGRLEQKLADSYKYGSKVPIMELLNSTDGELELLAEFIYEKVFKNYTVKQWGVKPEEIDGAVTARVPVAVNRDNRYFNNIYQGIPSKGHTEMIKRMLDHPNITVKLSVDFTDVKGKLSYDKLLFTGAIDEYFGYVHGRLPYRSVRFDIERVQKSRYQSVAVVNYPNNYDFTRITEFKHFLDDDSNVTFILKEYPQEFKEGENEQLYPIISPANSAIYDKYFNSAKEQKVLFAGRLGDYKYYDMDKAVERALELSGKMFN